MLWQFWKNSCSGLAPQCTQRTASAVYKYLAASALKHQNNTELG